MSSCLTSRTQTAAFRNVTLAACRIAAAAMALVFSVAGDATALPADSPVTPNASPEARSLLAYLSDVYGRKILSGQHESWRGTNDLGFELQRIQEASGKLPAILSLDLAGSTSQAQFRDRHHRVVKNAIAWSAQRKGIVSLCWHWFAPVGDKVFYTKETQFDVARGVCEGTPEYKAVLRDVDAIAAELKRLEDARVPVLWRPLHEANGRWFWWGAKGPEPFKKLWRLVFERLTFHHKLSNLIWVYSPGAGIELADWYPGDPYLDIIGQDHYPLDGNHGPARDIFDELVALRSGVKMVGLSENGPIPDPVQLVDQKANWLFFITWSGRILTQNNPAEQLKAFFNHPHVLTLKDLPDLDRYPFKPAGRAASLGFAAPPGPLAVGSPGRTDLCVSVLDISGSTVRAGRYIVTLALAAGPEGANLGGTLAAATVNGVAAFPDIRLSKPGKDYAFQATAQGLLTATSPTFEVGPGNGITREWWDNAAGVHCADLANLATPPAGREILGTAFETPVILATNFAARFRGCLLPPLSGAYQFRLASTATSQLRLSTDATPANKILIAEVKKGTPYRKWPHTNETDSSPVNLEAGKAYYLEVLQTQVSGSTHLALCGRLPNGSEESPIPGARLASLPVPTVSRANSEPGSGPQ
jgi:mannan endo-1,4-beta-mannosidase